LNLDGEHLLLPNINFGVSIQDLNWAMYLPSTSKFEGNSQKIKLKNNPDFEKLQYGLTLSVGYNTWNAYLYYALNPIFKEEAKINAESIHINAIKIGLIFYIL